MFTTVSFFILVLFAALGNLCLGYATGVYFRRVRQEWDVEPDSLPEDPTTCDAKETPRPATPEPAPEPAASAREESPFGQSVRQLRDQTIEHRNELVHLDRRVRDCAEEPTLETAKQCASDLKDINQRFLEQQETAMEQLGAFEEEAGALSLLGDQLRSGAAKRAETIRQSQDRLERRDLSDDDLEQYCRELLADTTELVESCDASRNALDGALSEIARCEDSDAELVPIVYAGEQAERAFQAALDTTLAEWTRDCPDHTRPLSVAVIDMDEFRQVNEQYGPLTGDRVLKAIGEIISAVGNEGGELLQRAGQRFLLSFANADCQVATGPVEWVRQTIDKIRFEAGSREIVVTVSCAIVEARADDTPHTLHARLMSALQEAKRYGRNQTFHREGDYAAPVVPPNLAIDEKLMRL